jgi:hypothetical protein
MLSCSYALCSCSERLETLKEAFADDKGLPGWGTAGRAKMERCDRVGDRIELCRLKAGSGVVVLVLEILSYTGERSLDRIELALGARA